MVYEFEVPSKIIGKGRPRLNTYTGNVYTPTKTKDYETLIRQYFIMKYHWEVEYQIENLNNLNLDSILY